MATALSVTTAGCIYSLGALGRWRRVSRKWTRQGSRADSRFLTVRFEDLCCTGHLEREADFGSLSTQGAPLLIASPRVILPHSSSKNCTPKTIILNKTDLWLQLRQLALGRSPVLPECRTEITGLWWGQYYMCV